MSPKRIEFAVPRAILTFTARLMQTFKIPAAFSLGLQALGIDTTALLRRSGLPLALWSTGKGMVTTEQCFALWRALEELCDA